MIWLIAFLAGCAGGATVLATYRLAETMAHRAQMDRQEHTKALILGEWSKAVDMATAEIRDLLDKQRMDTQAGIVLVDDAKDDDPEEEDDEVKRKRENRGYFG